MYTLIYLKQSLIFSLKIMLYFNECRCSELFWLGWLQLRISEHDEIFKYIDLKQLNYNKIVTESSLFSYSTYFFTFQMEP